MPNREKSGGLSTILGLEYLFLESLFSHLFISSYLQTQFNPELGVRTK
jgi:hypothetical protein